MKTVSVIIPAYRPGKEFGKLLRALANQTYPIQKIIIMNTDKQFWDQSWIAGIDQAEVFHLAKSQFDHGATRSHAAKLCTSELMLFMTHDSQPADKFLVEKMVAGFGHPGVGAAYARQLPAAECKIIERYTRIFNYPEHSCIKTKQDLPVLGIKTYFCSNVCAMYDREVFKQLGGFPEHAIFNEDMVYAGHLIQAGYKVAYVAEARVIHSHNYSSIQQFKRNFDLAVSQVEFPEVFKNVKSEKEGMRLVRLTGAYLLSIHKPWLIIDLLIKSAFKYIGFRMGKLYKYLPKPVILVCTMNKAYWTSGT